MPYTLSDLARRFDLTLEGAGDTVVIGVCGITDDRPDHLSFVASAEHVNAAAASRIPAFITGPGTVVTGKHNLLHPHPELAIARIAGLFTPAAYVPRTAVHPNAVIAESAVLAPDVVVGPQVIIGERVRIGARSRILAGCVIMDDAVIGSDCLIYPNCVIRETCELGCHVILQPGVIIGGDGFGFVHDGHRHAKIPQIGKVLIADDVEIGANSTVDRARFSATTVGRGTKIDNLVMIAHNVQIGENCLILAQCGIAGSTRIGNNVTLAGQVGVIGHLAIADDVIVLSHSLVTKDLRKAGTYAGYPAAPAGQWRAAVAEVRRRSRKRQ